MQIPTSRQNTSIITFTKALFCSNKKNIIEEETISKERVLSILRTEPDTAAVQVLFGFFIDTYFHLRPLCTPTWPFDRCWRVLLPEVLEQERKWSLDSLLLQGAWRTGHICLQALQKVGKLMWPVDREEQDIMQPFFFPLSNLIKFVMLPACWPVKLWSNVSAYRALICMIADDVTSPSSPRVFDSCALSFSFRLTTPSIFVLDWAATKACCMCAPFDAFSVLSWYKIRRLNHLVKTFGCVACLLWPYIQKYYQNVPVLNFSQLCPLLLPDKLACSAWACTCTTVATFV